MFSAPYFKIESFGAVDGPGIRLVIFLQGCPYRCIYCHNPESWATKETKKNITPKQIISIYKKNINFYKNGGITISGGEPLLHKEFCLELAKKCFKKKISLAFDTSGAMFTKKEIMFFKDMIKYNPLWIVDIKAITPSMHKKITRTTSELREIEMIKFLEKNKNHFIIRLVALKNYTDQQKDLLKIKKFISTLKFVDKFEVLPFHQLAMSKYDNLQIKYVLEDTKELTNKQIKKIENIFIKRSK